MNRHPYVHNPQIITDYFRNGQWQMVVIEIVYMGHMITAYPNFLIVSKYTPIHAESASSRCSRSRYPKR